MLAAGLMEMPPVSKVMPLPTSATFGAPASAGVASAGPAAAAGTSPCRRRGCRRSRPSRAPSRRGSRPQSGGGAESLCAVGELGGEEVARRGVDEFARGGDGLGDRRRTGSRVRRFDCASRAADDDQQLDRARRACRPGLGADFAGLELGEPVGAEVAETLGGRAEIERRTAWSRRCRRRCSDRAAAPADLRICSASTLSGAPSPTASTLSHRQACGCGDAGELFRLALGPDRRDLGRDRSATPSGSRPSPTTAGGSSSEVVRPMTRTATSSASVVASERSGPEVVTD